MRESKNAIRYIFPISSVCDCANSIFYSNLFTVQIIFLINWKNKLLL